MHRIIKNNNTEATARKFEDKAEEKPTYYVSFAATSECVHNFIIITKRAQGKKIVIASFGLYSESECYKAGISSSGIFSENGRLRSDHYFLENSNVINEISFSISQKQALEVLRLVKKDSQQNVKRYDFDTKSSKKFARIFKFLDPEEIELFLWFRTYLNSQDRGGPNFNVLDFNCKSYAKYVLRYLGIEDAVELGRLPDTFGPRMKEAARFQDGIFWNSEPNLQQPYIKRSYPEEFSIIFFAHNNAIEGALALLNDYADNSLLNWLIYPRRHHCTNLQKILTDVTARLADFNDVEQLVKYIQEKAPAHRSMTGTLQNRLDFLLEQHGKEYKKADQAFTFEDYQVRLAGR